MSFSHTLSNALSGLSANSRWAEVVSNNLANSMTDGYGRRELMVSSRQVGGAGAGVKIDGISRIVDRGLISDRRVASSAMAHDSAIASALASIEQVAGRVGDPGTIGARMAAFEQALTAAGADPASDQRLGTVVSRMSDLASTIRADSKAIQAARTQADADIASQIKDLNTGLSRVEALNIEISRSKNSGNDPSGLMDERQRVVDRIAEIVPVRQIARAGEQIALVTPTGEVLVDGPAKQFEFAANPLITDDMTLATGRLGGITVKGQPMGADGFGKLSGGSLAAAFELRDTILVDQANGLDQVAADLIGRFEDAGFDSSRAPGMAGLFTDAGAELAGNPVQGLAGRIAINDLVDPSAGGAVWRLRDGIGAAAPGPVGNAAQISLYADALNDLRAVPGSAALRSAGGHASDWTARLGTARVEADDALSFTASRHDSLKSAELAGGVDSDAELQKLLMIQEAYAANAKVISTVQQMMQLLMEL